VPREIEVLNPEPAALQDAETSAVKQARHEVRHAGEPQKDGSDLLTGQDDGEPFGSLGAYHGVEPRQVDGQDLAVEEQEGAQSLILGRRGDPGVNRQRSKELRDLRRAHLGRMAFAVEEDVPFDPVDVCLLGPPTVVASADRVSDAVEKPRFWRIIRTGLAHGEPWVGSFVLQSCINHSSTGG
jgi:hypothetical protein